MDNVAFIALGSNIGDRYTYLEEAAKHLVRMYPVEIVNTSSIYETDPVGYENQDAFLNMVVEIKTSLSPEELLHACLTTEAELGRKRDIRWGPRTIDLDVLLYNTDRIDTEELIVPHPRMHERAFVLLPLSEICEEVHIQGTMMSISSLTEQIPDKEGVRVWKQKIGEDVFALFVS